MGAAESRDRGDSRSLGREWAMTPSDDEIQEEIAAHLRMAIADKMARGASREEAERTARAEFGNVTHVAEVTREMRGGLWLERLGQDLRYGWRALRRTPAFTLVAVLTLALAIGANSAVFTVVDSVLLQPLPFRDPGRLYAVSYLPTNLPFELPPGLDDRLYLEYRRHDLRFERVTGYQRQELTLSGVGDATRVPGARAGATFFAVLGVQPALGRGVTPGEGDAGRGASPAQRHGDEEGAGLALHPAGRGRLRAPHRVRQRGEPALDSRRDAAPRDGAARRAGREPRAHCAAAADRERADRTARGHGGDHRGLRRRARPPRHRSCRAHPADRRSAPERLGARVHSHRLARHRHPLRGCAGPERRAPRTA